MLLNVNFDIASWVCWVFIIMLFFSRSVHQSVFLLFFFYLIYYVVFLPVIMFSCSIEQMRRKKDSLVQKSRNLTMIIICNIWPCIIYWHRSREFTTLTILDVFKYISAHVFLIIAMLMNWIRLSHSIHSRKPYIYKSKKKKKIMVLMRIENSVFNKSYSTDWEINNIKKKILAISILGEIFLKFDVSISVSIDWYVPSWLD